ncbi:MAG: pilus assembly protein TadG-related protein [Actinomycetota bacterium]
MRRTAHRREEGAVAVITALVLVALMAGVALTVDVGGMLLRRRAMVNGADAAALAAAQSCADATLGSPEALADEYAAKNVPITDGGLTGGVITGIDPESGQQWTINCGVDVTGHVSVRYQSDQSLFFAPVLGFDQTSEVTSRATASWGAAGATGPIPLVIYQGFFQGNRCDVPNVAENTVCYIWEDNDLSGGGDFGFLSVGEGWDVGKSDDCNNSGGSDQLAGWMNGADPVEVQDLNYPNATWVCTIDGARGNNIVWQALEDLAGQIRDFPIVGVSPGDGEPAQVFPPQPKYNVVGFAQFEIMGVNMPSQEALSCAIPPTATLPFDLMATCATPGDGYIQGSARANGANLTVDANGVITAWSRQPNIVTFETTGSAECGGNPPPNSSAHCLVLKWKGARIGGAEPGGGAYFGLLAAQLCDLPYRSCIA